MVTISSDEELAFAVQLLGNPLHLMVDEPAALASAPSEDAHLNLCYHKEDKKEKRKRRKRRKRKRRRKRNARRTGKGKKKKNAVTTRTSMHLVWPRSKRKFVNAWNPFRILISLNKSRSYKLSFRLSLLNSKALRMHKLDIPWI